MEHRADCNVVHWPAHARRLCGEHDRHRVSRDDRVAVHDHSRSAFDFVACWFPIDSAWWNRRSTHCRFVFCARILCAFCVRFVCMFCVRFVCVLCAFCAFADAEGDFEAPCRTKKVPREVPAIPWYRQLPVQMAMAGFLPFSAIYIEMFYIFSSLWGHSTYQLFGVIFIVFLILLIVCACITIALTYFQLSLEDHRWWWPAFLSGG
jgi:hypothetical protein